MPPLEQRIERQLVHGVEQVRGGLGLQRRRRELGQILRRRDEPIDISPVTPKLPGRCSGTARGHFAGVTRAAPAVEPHLLESLEANGAASTCRGDAAPLGAVVGWSTADEKLKQVRPDRAGFADSAAKVQNHPRTVPMPWNFSFF
jgi:hypothetical protein